MSGNTEQNELREPSPEGAPLPPASNLARPRDEPPTVRQARDDERRRIARELHDGVAQDVLAALMELQRIRRKGALDPELAVELTGVESLCETALHELRTLSFLLRPARLDGGLAGEVGAWVERFRVRTGIQVELSLGGAREVPPGAAHTLFRVIQEALTNVYRHTRAATASVRIVRDSDALKISICNPAPEKEAPSRTPGLGLQTMRERVEELGGKMQLTQAAGETTVEISLPLDSEGG